MSSNIKVQRICKHCGKEFTAKTTVTKYCGDTCAKRNYKARQRAEKVEVSNKETLAFKTSVVQDLNAKVFLTVRDLAKLINCSLRTTYRLIKQGNIPAVNIAERKILIRKSVRISSTVKHIEEADHNVTPFRIQEILPEDQTMLITDLIKDLRLQFKFYTKVAKDISGNFSIDFSDHQYYFNIIQTNLAQ